jgi:hypothetical protein
LAHNTSRNQENALKPCNNHKKSLSEEIAARLTQNIVKKRSKQPKKLSKDRAIYIPKVAHIGWIFFGPAPGEWWPTPV